MHVVVEVERGQHDDARRVRRAAQLLQRGEAVHAGHPDVHESTLIVRELLHGPHRFNELREALPGISPHTLTNHAEDASLCRRESLSSW
ncbi:winged helix-turn-helix transcriptional regulator [Streptomyces sp. NPDC024017]|uniref:winged helix-turn-helix transcriptional regulator n=1 Tax=Streptomyces sp. NPDC024017 TaxID=3154326 RepID=UPI0033C5BAED